MKNSLDRTPFEITINTIYYTDKYRFLSLSSLKKVNTFTIFISWSYFKTLFFIRVGAT